MTVPGIDVSDAEAWRRLYAVPTALRVALIAQGILFLVWGRAWRRRPPSPDSLIALRFRVCRALPELHEAVHRRMGNWFLLLGIFFLIPFPNLVWTWRVQMPLIALVGGAALLETLLWAERRKREEEKKRLKSS
ncbi:MAG: hypothetical protein D6679_07760 [Candidatus Hydrogenedentota bacterium]|nr:MAG: hypothetical protein D6679_07760 [Candidatus Hydrogenedentota bacterium]